MMIIGCAHGYTECSDEALQRVCHPLKLSSYACALIGHRRVALCHLVHMGDHAGNLFDTIGLLE
jgi:hypothetical protein